MLLKDKIELINRKLLPDDRGFFVKTLTGNEANLSKEIGEIYVTRAVPGGFRANHYHKITNEWFTVIQGKATAIVEDIETKERLFFVLDAKNPQTLYCPFNVAHVFINEENSDEDFILIAYADKQYIPNDTIMYDLTK